MVPGFIHEDWLLQTPLAQRLYHEVAARQPIIDYHSHLPAADIAANRRFRDLSEIWLAGDHYKWRAMRTNGVAEEFCTGAAPPYEKFLAWARTVPQTLRNPLYHWSHLELQRYFGINELLSEQTAPRIWDEANARLQDPDRDVHGILRSFHVEVVCTTDDPVDTLEHHARATQTGLGTRVLPTFRPDKLLRIDEPAFFVEYLGKLEAAANVDVASLPGLLEAIRQRHDYFHQHGCRLSDHGLPQALASFGSVAEVAAIYEKGRHRQPVSAEEKERFGTHLMVYFAQLDAARGWTKQLHLGALRNTNTRRYRELGPDAGFDSIGDWPQAERLARYLDRLDQDGQLPKVILYNLNPADNYVLGAMLGNFQDGAIPGKIQFGSGWWFLDQREGMTGQLNALSQLGLLSRFVGMLTDSRSFLSFPRHEYFRRLLCDLLGSDAARGEIPADFELLAGLVQNVCHDNAARYFGLAQA